MKKHLPPNPIQLAATSIINPFYRKNTRPQQISGAISSDKFSQSNHHQKKLDRLHEINTTHHRKERILQQLTQRLTSGNILSNNVNCSHQHLRDLHIICWNVNGGLNAKYNHRDLTQIHFNNHPSSTIIMVQEAIGTKGGYHENSQSALANITNMNLNTTDPYYITAIYVHNQCHNYVPIQFPTTIYNNVLDPLHQMHVTAILLQINKPIRSRNDVVILNL